MTLEDFFTITELKDGLTVTSRVEELVSSIQSNGGDGTRQWAAVASTIAATKNRECLDVFVNLDGYRYFSSWLNEAKMSGDDSSVDRSIEESVVALLEAIENLGVDSSKLVSSGIWVAVKRLVDHGGSYRIQDQARKLFYSWKDNEVREVSVEKPDGTLCSTQSSNEKDRLDESNDASIVPGSAEEENNADQGKCLESQNDKDRVDSNTMTDILNGSSTDDIVKEVEDNLSVKEKGSIEETSDPTNFGNMSERDSGEGPSNAPLASETSKEKTIGTSSAGHIGMSSDSIVASMELEKDALMQSSSLDTDEVSKNVSQAICGSLDVSITHNSKQLSTDNNITVHADNEVEKDKGHSDREKRVKRRKKRKSSRSMTISQRLGAIDKTSADIDLGILDALEVATKVAQEVAREVDSDEPSHSSSGESSAESEHSGSQDDDQHMGSPSKGENHSLNEPHVGGDDVMDEKNNKSENGMMECDDVEEATAKPDVGREKGLCDFDLNDDIFPDETDVIMSSITTNAAAAAPLQMESGKGLADTSVFHPASPQGKSRDKQVVCRGIDLNEVGDEQVEEITPWKQIPFYSSSSMGGGESSNEANLRGSNRFNLDLNCTNEEDDMPPPPSEMKMETRLFLSHNGQQSASPSSSLSHAQQSGKEISFDLNDRPQFFIDSRSDQSPYYGQQQQHPWSTSSYRGQEPGISILGTKVDVERKDTVSQMASFLSNGKSIEPAFMGRTGYTLGLSSGVSYSPASMYGYNGFSGGGPPGLSMSSSPMYVPGSGIPYMVDSRGTPVMMPQIMGSTPYMQQQQPSFPQQHMFMGLPGGGSSGLNGSVRPSFEQSSGFGFEMGNREPLSLRQFLSPEQSGGMGEHSGANAEPSSSSSISIGGKRKEPETRWEFPPWR